MGRLEPTLLESLSTVGCQFPFLHECCFIRQPEATAYRIIPSRQASMSIIILADSSSMDITTPAVAM